MCAYYDNVDGVADVSSSDNKHNSYKVYRVVVGLFAAVLDYILCEQIKHLGAAALQWLLDMLSNRRFFVETRRYMQEMAQTEEWPSTRQRPFISAVQLIYK